MSETETTTSEEAPQSAPETAPAPAPSPSFDFSDVRGFQSLGAANPEDPEAYAVELVKELTARAERFAQSVDDSIVLASDGVVRWLGDPVGRLIAGDEVLQPRAVLLADEVLPAEPRETVEKRLGLWVSAHLHKVLGPLEALVAAEGLADGAHEVATKLAESLGVLDRERVRAQVKGLDQNARAALRKLGVRFGAHYVFVPALLKPGARTLCSQLHALKHSVEAGAERLLAFAAAGRTSFVAEGALSADSYRIAGFRLCGERVVRVDIVERLTDLIRAAIPDQMRPGSAPASEAAGFLVTQQMTSLTGCAGESFASILRSLGYESHQVKKSEFEAATRRPEPAATEPAAVVSVAAETHEGEAESHDGEAETHDGETAEPVATAAEDVALEASHDEPAPAEEPVGETEAPEPVVEDAEPAAAEPALEDAEPAAAESAVEDADPAEAEDGESAGESAPATEELIEVWRPAPRQRRQHHHHHHHRRHGASEGTGRIVWRAKEPTAEAHAGSRRDPGDTKAQTPASSEQNPATAGEGAPDARRDESSRGRPGDRRGQPQKGPRREDRRPDYSSKGQADSAPRKDQRVKPIDPDSPFAKLLALKPLLEKQDRRK